MSSNEIAKDCHIVEIEIKNPNELNEADHICICLDSVHFLHAIVDSITETDLVIIFYDRIQQTSIVVDDDSPTDSTGYARLRLASNEELQKDSESSQTNSKIREVNLPVTDLSRYDIYKLDYSVVNRDTLDTNDTLHLARSLIGVHKYNKFNMSSDEHFATYCKTGKTANIIILTPHDLKSRNLFEKNSADASFMQKITSLGALLVHSNSTSSLKYSRESSASALPMTDVLLTRAAESLVKKQHDHEPNEKKKLSKRVKKEAIAIAGSVAGGSIGQVLVPVPLMGTVIGSLLGYAIGTGIARSKYVRKLLSRNKTPKETTVLHNLVFKIDKDTFKDNRFDYLKSNESTNKHDANNNEADENAMKDVDDFDYDIYVLQPRDNETAKSEVHKLELINYSSDEDESTNELEFTTSSTTHTQYPNHSTSKSTV